MQDGGAKNGWETYDFRKLDADCAASVIADAERAIAKLYAERHEKVHIKGTFVVLLKDIPPQTLGTVHAHLVKKNPSLQDFLTVEKDCLLFGQQVPYRGPTLLTHYTRI